MNAVNKSFTKRQVQKEFARLYNDMRVEAFKQNFEELTRQSVAVIMAGLAMRGYEREQILEIYESMVDMCNLPEFFGKTLTTDDAEKKCAELGIDLNRIHVGMRVVE